MTDFTVTIPEGFALKSLHHYETTAKGAEVWWAYIRTTTPEPNQHLPGGKYYHFQGATGFSPQSAIDAAHQALVKSLEARKSSAPKTPLLNLKIDLSKIRRIE